MGIATPPPYEFNTPIPTVLQQATTAASDIAKQAVGALPPSPDTTFTDLTNKTTLWKYDSSPGHPTLAPMGNTRVAGANVPDSQWQAFVASIVSSLPQDVQAKLAEFNQLSPEERNSASFENYDDWNALNTLVNVAAQTEFFITFASGLLKSENTTNEAVLNSELPSIVTNHMVQDAEEMAQALKDALKEEINNPEKDACTYLLTQFESLISELPKPGLA